MKPGGKLIDKESDTIYVIRNVDQKNILLVSEDGEFSMFLRRDSIVTSGFEPLYDWPRLYGSGLRLTNLQNTPF